MVVVGGGIAGIAAACVLAERGVEVTLLEREARLGGRMRAQTESVDGAPFELAPVHTIHRHYYNLRSLLRRVDPQLASLRALDDYPVLGRDGTSESFANLPSTAPFNVLALLRRTPFVKLGDLRQLSGERARQLLLFDPQKSFAEHDTLSARSFLEELGLPPRAREMLFRVFTHAVFNDDATLSAAEMLASLHFHFLGNPEGMLFDVLDEPASDALLSPIERYLRSLGVEVLTGTNVRFVHRDKGDCVRVEHDGGPPIEARGLVIALHVRGLRVLAHDSPDLLADAGFARSVHDLAESPSYAVLRLFLDRAPSAERPPFASVAGFGCLDTVTWLDRIEGESRRFALRTGGSVVQLQGFGVPEIRSDAEVERELTASLFALYPELADARVLHTSLVRRADCPSFAPGTHATRPRVATPYGNIALAGDYVKLPFPSALLERAVASGFLAANTLLDRWDVRGERLYTLPPRAFLTSLIPR